MFRGLFGSWVWRSVAAITSVIGVTMGLAFTGALPGLGQDIDPAAGHIQAAVPSPTAPGAAIPLEFPDLPWLNQTDGAPGAQELTLAVTQPTQEAAQPQVIVEEVLAAPTPECVHQITVGVSSLVAGVAGVSNLDLARALDVQARHLLEAAKNCAGHAAAVGQAVDQANLLVQQTTVLVGQITGLVGQLGAPLQGAAPASPPAAGGVIGTAVGGVLGVTAGVVNTATGAVGGLLNALLVPK
jgi:hypothetical protein